MGLKSNDVSGPVHDGTVRIDRAFDDFIIVFEVDDNDLRLIAFVEFLPDADVMIGL